MSEFVDRHMDDVNAVGNSTEPAKQRNSHAAGDERICLRKNEQQQGNVKESEERIPSCYGDDVWRTDQPPEQADYADCEIYRCPLQESGIALEEGANHV